MQVLEDFVPYDRSARWRLHHAYYAACGRAAWDDGAIPFYASSNFGIARQHAELFCAWVAALERAGTLGPRQRVWLLDVGAGSGAFAASFLRALDVACGEAGRRLRRRLRYVLSDYSEQTVREAAESDPLRAEIEAGTVVPALFDLTKPDRLVAIDGQAIDAPLAGVIANYVCCVAPLKVLRKDADGVHEQYVRLSIDAEDPAARFEELLDNPTAPDLMRALEVEGEWRRLELNQFVREHLHSKVIDATWAAFDEASLPYPYTFVEAVRALRERLVDGGMLLVNDYGNAGADELRQPERRIPQHYGNAINHGVEFTLFDAIGKVLGFGVERTRDTLRAVHTAALGKGRLPRGIRETFARTHVARSDGEDLLDFSKAAQHLFRDGLHRHAARLYERCLRLDPDDTELLYRAGEACLEAEFHERALELLTRGQELDRGGEYDFAFLIGRLQFRLGDLQGAREAFVASTRRGPNAQAWVNLGHVYEALGDPQSAFIAWVTALEIDPAHEQAKALVEKAMPLPPPPRENSDAARGGFVSDFKVLGGSMRDPITIDCEYLAPELAAAYLVVEGDEAAFVETNTAYAVPRLLRALEKAGRRPEEVRWIIVTHVHLDHAGGASALARACPNATVLAHPRAAPHLIDPSRLVASARKVYGDEPFRALYGEIEPIPAGRVRIMQDEETLGWGSRTFRFLHTRGHANHHFCIVDSASEGVFTGDAFGLRYPALQGAGLFMFPSTSPTDFDPEAAIASVQRIEAAGRRAYLTHFGEVMAMHEAADLLAAQLEASGELLARAAASDLPDAELGAFCRGPLRERLVAGMERAGFVPDEAAWKLLELDLDLNAQGIAFAAAKRRAKGL